jgi:hypothetical protein
MRRVRRALGPIAAVWLAYQAATLALVPVLLATGLADCVCSHGADASCPMHHKTDTGSKVCVMQSATTNAPAPVNALFGVTGPLPTLPEAIVPVRTASAVLAKPVTLTQRPSLPDPPPPRA